MKTEFQEETGGFTLIAESKEEREILRGLHQGAFYNSGAYRYRESKGLTCEFLPVERHPP